MANNFLNRVSKVFSGKAPPGTAPSNAPSVEALQQEVARLNRSVAQLSFLNEMALAMGASVDSDDIVRKLVDRTMRAIEARQAVVTLVDGASSDPMKTRVRVVSTSTQHTSYHMNEALLGWMHLHKKPLAINDPSTDDRFRGIQWDPSIRSVLCAPLMMRSELIGVITAYNKKGAASFSEEDEKLLSIIAGQAAHIIENARQSMTIAGMREQVRLAFEIQRNLLPKSPPAIEGYDVYGKSVPAQTVGGDYYDFIETSGGDWAICLGDVSGKGLPASLLMANLQATLRAQTIADIPVAERIRLANRLMYRNTDDEKFATLFYGVLDVRNHSMAFCNAGHELPFMDNGGAEPVRLSTGGMALGILDDFQYDEKSVALKPGDLLVVYSDGVTDATDAKEEMFGVERLTKVIADNKKEPAAVLGDIILRAVNEHVGETPQDDDLTIVVLRRVH